MFTWLNKQGVQSDKGFIVQTTGRFTIEYREGARTISVYAEPGIADEGRYCEIIEPDAFERWDDDPPYVVLPPEKQDEILANFTEAIEFKGLAVVIKGERT